MAISVGAENKVPATTFNGPDPIRILSKEAKEWIKKNPNLYNNYRIRYDVIGNFGAYFGDKVDSDELGISRFTDAKKKFRTFSGAHSLHAYIFNSNGQIVDERGNVVGTQYRTSPVYLMTIENKYQMSRLGDLKKKWQKSGGKLSSTEEIFLDAAQGNILGNSMADAAHLGAEEVSNYYDTISQELESLWSGVHFHSYVALPYYEVEALFASYGITYQQLISDVQGEMQEKVDKMAGLASEFDGLNTKIQAHIDSVLETDKQLAGEFKEWQNQM
ncbi:hypothetical protein [Streptococcus suis]